MVIAVGADVPQGGVQVVARANASDARISEGGVIAIYNIPSQNLATSFAGVNAVVRQAAHIEVSEAGLVVVARGRIGNPRLRAWTFTLDGHDFYVLRLGDTETLVYDTYSKQWMDWDSGDDSFWRANIGISWAGGAKLARDYGSQILIGDDTWGLLWLLDPELGYDENPDYLSPTQELEFERVVMGQYPKRGYDAEPCYNITLDAALGVPTVTAPYIKLETSDDAGHTFIDQGDLVTTVGDFTQVLVWDSLGQIAQPGRLFRITDNGATPAIYDMEMNSDAG